MGLLGRLIGKEKIKFPSSRDVERNEAREERNQRREISREEHRAWKQQQKEAYREEFRRARLERIKQNARKAGSTTLSDRINRMASPPVSSSKPVYRQPARNYSTHNNYNPFGTLFDTGMNYKTPKRTGGTRYAVVGGKAYPVAGKHKKKKKHRRSSGFGVSGFDMTDNWGFMK